MASDNAVRPSSTLSTPSSHFSPKQAATCGFWKSKSTNNTDLSGWRAMLIDKFSAVSVFPQAGVGEVIAKVFQPFKSIACNTRVRNMSNDLRARIGNKVRDYAFRLQMCTVQRGFLRFRAGAVLRGAEFSAFVAEG